MTRARGPLYWKRTVGFSVARAVVDNFCGFVNARTEGRN